MLGIPFHIFAWIASVMYGLETIVGKLTSRHAIQNPWLFNFLWSLFILLLMVPVALANGAGIPTHWLFIIAASFFYAAASALFVLALYKLDVSVLAPLFSFRTAMAVILGALFLGEVLTLHQYLLIGVIFVFGIFVAVDERFNLRSFFTRGTAIALLSMLALVLMAIFTKKAIAETTFWDASIWIALLGQLWLLPTIALFKRELAATTAKQYGIVFATALAGVVGTLAANAAYAANVSIAATIISLPFSMVLAFLFSVFAPELLEHHTLKVYAVRFVSATIVIVAALNL